MVELEALGGVKGHDRQFLGGVRSVVVHHQADMLEKAGQRRIVRHGPRQLDEVFKPAIGFDRFVGLPHRDIARFVEDDPRQLGMGQVGGLFAPACQVGEQALQGPPCRRRQRISFNERRSSLGQGPVHPACLGMERAHRLVAQAPLGDIGDAFERQGVVGGGDDAQVSQRIADFGAFVEAKAADDLVGQADRNEAILESPRLELGADEDCHVVQ